MTTDRAPKNLQTRAALPVEQEVVALLSELSNVQDELLSVLDEKRKGLGRGDLAAVNEIQVREESLLARLTACQQRRQEVLQHAQSQGLPSQNLGELATSVEHGSSHNLRNQVKDANSRMRLLQTGLLTNWLLAQRTLLHISQLLEIIATGGRIQPTYVMSEAVQARGALLDQEA